VSRRSHELEKRHRIWTKVRTSWWGVICVLIVAISMGIISGLAAVYRLDLPQIDDLGHFRPVSDTVLYDELGRPYAFFALQHREIAQFNDFPKVLYDAVLSIEDKNFEKHAGIDTLRILSAACRNALGGRVQGASTLTMQLARNLFLSPEQTYTRKIKEILLSIQLEHRLTKQQIFTLYANEIYLGEGVYGLATGAEYYFGKPVSDLSIEEAALLAALPKAPITYSPRQNLNRALQRRNLVIDSMAHLGRISLSEATAAKHKPIVLKAHKEANATAPYFVEEVRQYLEKRFGSRRVHEEGLRVYTTLNLDLQRAAEAAVLDGLTGYERRHQSQTNRAELEISSPGHSHIQGALLAIDNASGEVKAMVGGRDFSTSKFNRATQALRQAGSSFKPYVYTAAVDRGATPLDVIFDTPQTFVTDAGPYAPHNYDGKFAGAMTLERALAESRNIPAVRLAAHVGISTVIDYARRFGIKEHIPPFLPAALGAADVTLMEQTSAFSTFPNDGLRALPHYIVKVTDYDGRILEETPPSVQDVIRPDTARTMTWMLRQVIQHGTASAAFRLRTPLAGKTGTTNNFTDAWFIGFSPSITCGVWVGFDEKKSLGEKETGARAALPIWMDFMAAALLHQPSNDFSAPPTFFERTVATQGDEHAPSFGQVPPDAQPALSGSRSVIPASNSDPVSSATYPNQ
jgi:1A family penicillin-binding protein